MGVFISTNYGLVNSDAVVKIKPASNGRLGLYDRDGNLLDETYFDPWDIIIQMVPITGEWEVLYMVEGDVPAFTEYCVVPVIAWGLTLDGHVLPIEPNGEISCEGTQWVRRKVGDPHVYDRFGTIHDNADSWLASLADAKRREAAVVKPKAAE